MSAPSCAFPHRLDALIFNFPHVGGKSNLRRARQLLRNIFEGVCNVLTPDARVFISLAGGQSELSETLVSVGQAAEWMMSCDECSHRMDSWQIMYVAGDCGWMLLDVHTFGAEQWPGYMSTGYKRDHRHFHRKAALTFEFRRADGELDLEAEQDKITEAVAQAVQHGAHTSASDKPCHLLRPYFDHDVSFWLLPGNSDEDDSCPALEHIRSCIAVASEFIVRVTEVHDLRYTSPEDSSVQSVVLRVRWQQQQQHMCLRRTQCNQLQEHLRHTLLNVQPHNRRWQLRFSHHERIRMLNDGLESHILYELSNSR